jgi:hypothetical protein
MNRKPVGSNDYLIHAALAAGTLNVDPSEGRVYSAGLAVDEHVDKHGYRRVCLSGRAPVVAHRVVWIACEDPIPLGIEVNHRNGVRHDNRISNLELTTHSENMAHAAVTPYYERIRDEDLAAVDPEWLARVISLAESGEVTAGRIAQLRPEARTPVGSPEYRQWHADQKVDQSLSGSR